MHTSVKNPICLRCSCFAYCKKNILPQNCGSYISNYEIFYGNMTTEEAEAKDKRDKTLKIIFAIIIGMIIFPLAIFVFAMAVEYSIIALVLLALFLILAR